MCLNKLFKKPSRNLQGFENLEGLAKERKNKPCLKKS
jgi:hypothetical protein